MNNTCFDRVLFKTRAKEALKGTYFNALIVSILLNLSMSAISTGSANTMSSNASSGVGTTLLSLFLSAAVIMFVLRIFLLAPIEIGCHRYFIEATQRRGTLGSIGFGFTNRYLNIVATILLRDVFLVLWFLLLVIPGLIKSYSYSCVAYILAENPNISPSRAIALSNQMTNGHKLDMWVLDLSFIGWFLLGMLACGVGVIFVHPYLFSTKAEMYLALRAQAIDRGYTSVEELTPASAF